jgi:DNA primase
MGRIPREFIDDLLERVDIVDVIGTRIQLKRAGKEYQALCPFHDEKTPSFTVSPTKQFYHCFGCGAHGSAIGFLMEHERLEFVEAIQELAALAGVPVPREAGTAPKGGDLTQLFDTLESAARFYVAQLRHHPSAAKAVDYLKGRGMSGKIAAAFRIGYAPPGWSNLIQAQGGTRQLLDRLRSAGLVIDGDQGHPYDRFRDRVIFPIRDHRGRVIAFGGRVLSDDKPKYLNSPETLLFHKGRELYGLYEARTALRVLPRLLVVEGYMDVVSLAQFGIGYAVATLGTATTAEHLDRLFRTSAQVVFCFDGDRAGRDAAWKALEAGMGHLRDGREIRFLFLPQGEDPDSLVRREGTEAFERRIADASPLSTFLFEHLRGQVDMATPEGRAGFAERAAPFLQRIQSPALREELRKQLELETGGRVQLRGPARAEARSASTTMRPLQRPLTPVRLALALLLRYPELARLDGLPQHWRRLDAPGIALLCQLLELLRSGPNLNTGMVLERWRGTPQAPHLEKLLRWELPGEEARREQELRDALGRLEQQYRERETERLLSKARTSALDASEKQRLKSLLGGDREWN